MLCQEKQVWEAEHLECMPGRWYHGRFLNWEGLGMVVVVLVGEVAGAERIQIPVR